MTREKLFEFCKNTYSTLPDYPFEDDFETAVMRHADNHKWFCICMKVPRRKLVGDSNEIIDVANVKLPLDMMGSFDECDGVYPAYHMNKLHWVSIILSDAPDEIVEFLTNASFEATKTKRRKTANDK